MPTPYCIKDGNKIDPACGSGNFLTETYLALRKLENRVIFELIASRTATTRKDKETISSGQVALGEGFLNPIKVSIRQFFGIEINDFAATVAKTALWIAESQMMKRTEDIVHMSLDFLPLKTYPNIIEGNALRMDWNDVVPASELSYIMGNPPFVGGMQMSEPQKADIKNVFGEVNGVGEMDYVCAWYRKASEMIVHTKILCAFVSTNSICQGEQVLTFWKYLMTTYDVKIDFAYTTFVWNSESNGQANVHCVIIGFSNSDLPSIRKLYFDSGKFKECTEINPYLCDAPTCFIESRAKPLCSVPPMRFGSMPRDGGHFVLSPQEREELIRSAPITADWIKPYIGAAEFLNNKMRYCLWLVGVSPALIHQCPQVRRRVDAVRAFRAASKAEGTRKFAETPSLFCQIAQPCASYIMVPKTSSGRRKYIPLGFQNADTIASDLVFLIPNAGLYEFGILMSNVHNSWMRLVAGRLKSDYRYSKDIVYNNFPWCQPTENQRTQIEQTAQGILDARAVYPDCSLSVLYDESLMPPELRKAHQQNDRAVMEAYGMPVKGMTESACVAELMRRYQALTAAKR